MEINGIGRITNKYTANDYLNLNLSINSTDVVWDKAIEIFIDRFKERYFEPIEKLIKNPVKYGFSIMAINCLLIDTFYQFENGKEETSNNSKEYPKFLINIFPDVFTSRDLAKKFYRYIRCGILHQAQTKRGSMLSCESNNIVEYCNGNESIRVNVIMFTKMLEKYFKDYILRLRNEDIITRRNFILKMNYICVDANQSTS